MANRHLLRSIVMQSLYEWDFRGKDKKLLREIARRNIKEIASGAEDTEFVYELIEGVVGHLDEIDAIMGKGAPEWPIGQINIVDRNVLRIGIYELIFGSRESVPPKVAINEAIELAKTFGGESSGKFINGVLGTIYRQMGEPGKDEGRVSVEEKKAKELAGAGAVVYRRINGDYRFALVHDIYGYWTFLKGHVEKGETKKETALREVKEELGLGNTKIIEQLGKIEYITKEPGAGLIKKKVTYFLVETTDSEIEVEKSPGIQDAKWFKLDEVLELKRYKDIEKIFNKALKLLKISVTSK